MHSTISDCFSIREVRMQLTRWSAARASADVMSGIVNWVCPECGGRMGGPSKEFKCQGECQMDWRQVWELVLSPKPDRRSKRTIRPN